MSTKTVDDAYTEEVKCNQSLESRIRELETALAGLCDALDENESEATSWRAYGSRNPMKTLEVLRDAWRKAHEALAPS